MKKIIATLALVIPAALGFSQGYVNFSTISSTYAISTNSSGFPGNAGNISADTGTTSPLYYFALIDQAYPGSGTPAQATPETIGNWSYAGLATNYIIAGSINGGSDVALSSLTGGTEYYVELVGWSADLGTSYATVENEYANYTFPDGGFFGESVVGTMTPGGAPPSPAGILFDSSGISSGFVLYPAAIPEPTTLMLAGLGGLSLLAFRRKKA